MINGKRVLAYIPARSGSKSIIDKNIVDVCDKPLIAYTIEAAKGSKYVDRIIVSTDSPRYVEIVQRYGAEAPFLRPAELCTDTAKERYVAQHVMEWVEANWQEKYDIILKLEPTSPLRLAEDIDKGIETLEEKNAETVVSVTEAFTHPYWMNTLPEDRSMKGFLRPEAMIKNRQELPVYYQLDGVVNVARWNFMKKNLVWFSDEQGYATITPNERAMDIDGPTQLELVRILIGKRLTSQKDNHRNPNKENPIENLFTLRGKVAVITGGAGMLGQQHAEVLSDAGAHVVIADIKQEICDNVAQQITQRTGIEAMGVEVDISQEQSVMTMLDTIKTKFGRVDILINNAVAKPKAFFKGFEEYPVDDWEQVMAVNMRGVFLCSKVVGSEMANRGKGVIINIGSTYGIVGVDQSIYGTSGINAPGVYSASKGGVINLTRYLATYWGKKGIRVNCLSPGGVENNQDPEFIKKYCAKTPLGRMARKDDYKGAILFLCSDASSYMTGANLIVDGGWTAW